MSNNTKTIIYAGKEHVIHLDNPSKGTFSGDYAKVSIGYSPDGNRYCFCAERTDGASVMFGSSNIYFFKVDSHGIKLPNGSYQDQKDLEYSRGLPLDNYRIFIKLVVEKIIGKKLSKVDYTT